MELSVNQILQGHCLDILRQLPADSIDCCITSPPYWALRDYETESVIWDADPQCNHEWEIFRQEIKSSKNKNFNERWGGSSGQRKQELSQQLTIESGFCIKCEAWRGSLGQEPVFDLYVKHIADIFDEVKRILKPEGSCWIVIADTYAGSGGAGGDWNHGKRIASPKWRQTKQKYKQKSLCLIPQRVAIELVSRGWILRNILIWHKPNVLPSSAKDRFTIDYEQILFLVKQSKYYFEQQLEPALTDPNFKYNGAAQKNYDRAKAQNPSETKRRILESQRKQVTKHEVAVQRADNASYIDSLHLNPNTAPLKRNKRCVWKVTVKANREAHFAIYPENLIKPMIKSGCPLGGTVLDPFFGIGTTGVVALKLSRSFLGIELNPNFVNMAENHLKKVLEYHLIERRETEV